MGLLAQRENAKVFAANGGAWTVPVARPEEIAQAVLLLISPEMNQLTGAALAIDGGRSLH